MTLHLNDLVDAAHGVIERCELDGSGRYKRWAVPPEKPPGKGRYKHPNGTDIDFDPAAINPYGVADAANLLYTLNAMPHDEAEHRGFIEVLSEMQDAETGLFYEGSHHAYHTTAHCVAAMELFEGLPSHPMTGMMEDATPEGIVRRLEGLDWIGNPWGQSHQGAGVYVGLKLSRQLSPEAERAYFDWLADRFDPEFGLLRKGCLPGQAAESFKVHGHMAGTFHYLFNMESARVPLPYPEALVDTCLAMHRDDDCPGLGRAMGFITIDWVYCLNRAVRQSGHRFAEAREAMRDVATRYVDFMRGLDHQTHVGFNDLHALFGAFCALAELQAALPGFLRTDRPLRLPLDRRPFI